MVEALIKAREAREWTRAELARRVGITPEYVSIIERGVQTPGFKLAKRIADVFNTTVDALFLTTRRTKHSIHSPFQSLLRIGDAG